MIKEPIHPGVDLTAWPTAANHSLGLEGQNPDREMIARIRRPTIRWRRGAVLLATHLQSHLRRRGRQVSGKRARHDSKHFKMRSDHLTFARQIQPNLEKFERIAFGLIQGGNISDVERLARQSSTGHPHLHLPAAPMESAWSSSLTQP